MDNDVVVVRIFPKIEEFLSSNRPLLLKEPFRYLGRYDCLFLPTEKYNSGFYGLPPNFDFAAALRSAWEANGTFRGLNYADEQGLITYVLKNNSPIFIEEDEVVELHQYGKAYYFNESQCHTKYTFTGTEPAYHFVQANRGKNHECWCSYKTELIKLL